MSYTKLDHGIVRSTMWCEPYHARILWITMLALTDQDGIVEASVPGLAHTARITLEECEDGLARFMKPDKYSRTPDDDGRRIREIDGGWELINHAKYRYKLSEEDRKEKARLRQQKARERKSPLPATDVTKKRDENVTERDCHTLSRMSHHQIRSDVDTDTDKNQKRERQKSDSRSQVIIPSLEEVEAYFKEKGIPVSHERFFDYYESIGWKVGGKPMQNWKAAARRWGSNEYADNEDNVCTQCRQNYYACECVKESRPIQPEDLCPVCAKLKGTCACEIPF
jgi:hypothetical protein